MQIPTRIPEKIVIALFSGILVNSGIPVVARILETIVSKYVVKLLILGLAYFTSFELGV